MQTHLNWVGWKWDKIVAENLCLFCADLSKFLKQLKSFYCSCILFSHFKTSMLSFIQCKTRKLPIAQSIHREVCARVVRCCKARPARLIRTHQPVLVLNLLVFVGVGISRSSALVPYWEAFITRFLHILNSTLF
jgi:hypothetical protein